MLTCVERLADARNALHEANIQGKVRTVTHNGRSITYDNMKPEIAISHLSKYIRGLQAECGTASEKAKLFRGRARRVSWIK